MASRIDDKLFIALLRGDGEALALGWAVAFTSGFAFAVGLFGGKDVSIAGQSAEDVASDATNKFMRAVASGSVKEGNVYGYLIKTVYTTFIDLVRKARREVDLADGGTDEGSRPEDDVADTCLLPEQLLGQRREVHARLVEWCEWPDRLSPACADRPVLVEMLLQMKRFLREQVVAALEFRDDPDDWTLLQLAETADPLLVCYSFAELNEFLLAHLKIGRNALDQRWKYLKRIAADHGLRLPTGLNGSNRAARNPGRKPISRKSLRDSPPTSA